MATNILGGFSANGPIVKPIVSASNWKPATTPAATALNNIQSNKTVSPMTSAIGNINQSQGVSATAPGGNPATVTNPVAGFGGTQQQRQAGLITPPSAPTAPIKSQTKNNVDGSSETVTYHAPAAQNNANVGGGISGNGGSSAQQNTPSGTSEGAPTPPPTPTPENKPVDTTYGGLIGSLANVGTNGSEGYNKAVGEQKQLKEDIAKQYSQTEAGGYLPLQFVQGREQAMGRQYASQLTAAQEAVQAQQTQQGQQIGALGTATGFAAPRQQGYVMIDPTTGQPVGGQGGANAAITQGAQYGALETGVGQSAIDSQAIRGAESGIASINDLITKGNLNPNSVNLVNEGIQGIQKNLSNSDYQTLLNSLDAINAALTKVTGTPVDIAALSSSQGTSLIATINNQVQIAKAMASAKAVPQTGGQTTPSTGGGLYDF